jgi:hypothetical protein
LWNHEKKVHTRMTLVFCELDDCEVQAKED